MISVKNSDCVNKQVRSRCEAMLAWAAPADHCRLGFYIIALLRRSSFDMLLMIDNYDSFTYNIVQYLIELGADVKVIYNDELTLEQIRALKPERIVVSPGPCTPAEAGVSMAVIEAFAGQAPILGVCLGHQCIGQVFGGQVIRAKKIMHGKTSSIFHSNRAAFKGLPNPLVATRYHSLVVAEESLPAELEITAWTQDEAGRREEVMGLKHKTLPIEGVQFHPESILSEQGHGLLKNFLSAR